ncbi:MAG: hypothetical protein NW201_03000 [Gemmatimonadales bacterium]|nr:hypothetical protein [Gemmatimonadales bacterium]
MAAPLSVAAFALVLAGCGAGTPVDANPNDPAQVALTQQQADTVAESVALDLDALGEGITSTGASLAGLGVYAGGDGVLAGYQAATPAQVQAAASLDNLANFNRRWDICTPAPVKTTQVAGNTTTITWVYSNCTISKPNAGNRPESVTRDGTVQVVRTVASQAITRTISFSGRTGGSPIPADVPGFTRTWTRFPVARPGVTPPTTAVTSSENRNGSRTVSGDANGLSSSESNMVTLYRYADASTARHTRTWQTQFTADTPGTIQNDQPLPAGTWTFGANNSSTWERGGVTRTVQTTTPVVNNAQGVHYNPTCTERPQFDRGTLRTVVTRSSNGQDRTSTVTVTFTACGEFTTQVQ